MTVHHPFYFYDMGTTKKNYSSLKNTKKTMDFETKKFFFRNCDFKKLTILQSIILFF